MRLKLASVLALSWGCNLFSPTAVPSGGEDVADANGVDAAAADLGDADAASELPTAVLAYDFNAVNGSAVPDLTPGPVNLEIIGDVAVSGGIATFREAGALETAAPPGKLYDAIGSSGQFSVSAWIRADSLDLGNPDDPAGNARIVTLSANSSERNVTLAQWLDGSILRVRTTQTSDNALPETVIPASLALTLQHHHLQFSNGQSEYYVDGVLLFVGSTGGDLSNWNTNFRLRVGDEFADERQWFGEIHDLRIYAEAFDAATVKRIFEFGVPGE